MRNATPLVHDMSYWAEVWQLFFMTNRLVCNIWSFFKFAIPCSVGYVEIKKMYLELQDKNKIIRSVKREIRNVSNNLIFTNLNARNSFTKTMNILLVHPVDPSFRSTGALCNCTFFPRNDCSNNVFSDHTRRKNAFTTAPSSLH